MTELEISEEIAARVIEITEAIELLCIGTSEQAIIDAAVKAYLDNYDDAVSNNKEHLDERVSVMKYPHPTFSNSPERLDM